jgi:histidine triad (HIT) family protein
MSDCIFCKIIKGEIPCYKIFENDTVLAFLDISQDSYGHTLVIPKRHIENIVECEEQTLNAVMSVTQKICKHYLDLGFKGINIINNAKNQQSVLHFHVHIFPRRDDNILSCFKVGSVKESLTEQQAKLKL